MNKLYSACHGLKTNNQKNVLLAGIEPMTFYTHGSEAIEYVSPVYPGRFK